MRQANSVFQAPDLDACIDDVRIFGLALQTDVPDGCRLLLFARGHDSVECGIVFVVVGHTQDDRWSVVVADAGLKQFEALDDGQPQHSGDDTDLPHAGSGGQADSGGQPDARGGGEAADVVPTDEDEASTDEAYPGHYLGRDARRVEHDLPSDKDVAEAVGADFDDESGAKANEGVGAKPSVLPAKLTFEANRPREKNRDDKAANEIRSRHVLRTHLTRRSNCHTGGPGYQGLR